MSYNNRYWSEKEERAEKAKEHSRLMKKKFPQVIDRSVKNTHIYGANIIEAKSEPTTNIEVVNMDSVSALFAYAEDVTAVLNFASYKNPGGMFLQGSRAQEEALCHESILYEVLQEFEHSYYEKNRKELNRALYKDRLLYSKDVMFHRGMQAVLADVITCAAPNKNAAMKYGKVTERENREALRSRIHFLLNVAFQNKVNTLILGAFGCGVFGQEAEEVALIFKEELKQIHFDRVIFAVYGTVDQSNLQAFQKVFA